MKTRFAITLELCLATVLGLGTASAAVTDIVNVKTDMAMSIGKTVLPAGAYTVRTIQDSGTSAVLEFTSANGHSVNAIVREIPTEGGEGSTKSSVVLRSDGEVYQVDKVWVEGRDYGYQLIASDFR